MRRRERRGRGPRRAAHRRRKTAAAAEFGRRTDDGGGGSGSKRWRASGGPPAPGRDSLGAARRRGPRGVAGLLRRGFTPANRAATATASGGTWLRRRGWRRCRVEQQLRRTRGSCGALYRGACATLLGAHAKESQAAAAALPCPPWTRWPAVGWASLGLVGPGKTVMQVGHAGPGKQQRAGEAKSSRSGSGLW